MKKILIALLAVITFNQNSFGLLSHDEVKKIISRVIATFPITYSKHKEICYLFENYDDVKDKNMNDAFDYIVLKVSGIDQEDF